MVLFHIILLTFAALAVYIVLSSFTYNSSEGYKITLYIKDMPYYIYADCTSGEILEVNHTGDGNAMFYGDVGFIHVGKEEFTLTLQFLSVCCMKEITITHLDLPIEGEILL